MPMQMPANPLVDYIQQTLAQGQQPPIASIGTPPLNPAAPGNDTLAPDGQREGDRRFITAVNAIQKNVGRNLDENEKASLMAEINGNKNWSDQDLVQLGTPKQ